MAIKVGNVVTHKGINYKVQGVETKNDVITVKLQSATGKQNTLSSTNPLFVKLFGEQAPKEDIDDVDMSEFKKGSEDKEYQAPKAKVEAKVKKAPVVDESDEDEVEEAPAPKKAKAKKAPEPEPEEEDDPLEIDWDNDKDPLVAAYWQYEEAAPADRLTMLWAWTKTKNLEPLAKLVLFAGYIKALSNYDYYKAVELIYEAKAKSDVSTLAEVDYATLAQLIAKTSKKKSLTDADYLEFAKFVPSKELDRKLFLQMILDGCFVAYGYTIKGIKESLIHSIFKDVYLVELPANK